MNIQALVDDIRIKPVLQTDCGRFIYVEPEFGSPPKDIFGGSRPFMCDEVSDFTLVKAGTKLCA